MVVNDVNNKKTYSTYYWIVCLFRETRIDSYKVQKDAVINNVGIESWKYSFKTKENIVQLILDCMTFYYLLGDSEIVCNIEKLSRRL